MFKLLLGGSPCTHWSIAQSKNRETTAEGIGWELFKNYVIAKEKFQPDFFLYENNKSAAKAIKDQICFELGHDLTHINSALVSAQNRERFYVTPLGKYIPQPEDRGILLRDILETGYPAHEKSYVLKAQYRSGVPDDDMLKRRQNEQVFEQVHPVNTCGEKAHTLKAQYYKNGIANFVTNGGFDATAVAVPCEELDTEYFKGAMDGPLVGQIVNNGAYKNGKQPSQQYRVYSCDEKSVCVDTDSRKYYTVPVDYAPHNDSDIVITDNAMRCQRRDAKHSTIQGTHVNFTDGKSQTVGTSHIPMVFSEANYEVINGANVLIANGKIRQGDERGSKQGKYVYTENAEKANTISAGQAHNEKVLMPKPQNGAFKTVYEVRNGLIAIKGKQYPIKLPDGLYIIRKLTVTECERLQTLPDGYTQGAGVSNTQCYRGLGNGWTAEVIIHILKQRMADLPRDTPILALSMYDGIATGRYCLDAMGFTNVTYHAYEIDKYAMQIANHNYPDIIQHGDAFQVREDEWECLI